MTQAQRVGRDLARRHLGTVVAVATALALAAALRFYDLTGQSLWNDEGTSVALAGRSLAQITAAAAADIHPPLYHYLLHYWLGLFGSGDAAARSLSALLGVGLVGLTYLLGRQLFGRLAGVAAAFVAAVSSYQVYYAQEARMYMLLTVLGAASIYLFYEGWLADEGRPARLWVPLAWVVVTALAAYTQYLAASLVLAENVAWLANPWRAWREGKPDRRALLRRALTWGAAQAVVGLLYLPWLRLTWAALHRWPAVSEPFGLLTLARRALSLFALGPTAQAGSLAWAVAVMLGIGLLGLALPGRRDYAERLLALAYWLMPVALLYYLSRSRPVYHPKFLVLATPGFTLLVARGIARLAGEGDRRWWRPALACGAGALVLVASLPGLRSYYFDPRYARDDYRGIARYIAGVGRPGDIVLINAPSQIETVARYYQGPLPMVPFPLERPPDRDKTERELAEMTQSARHVYGIFWATDESDPERVVEGWLDTHAYKALDAWYGNVRLVAYAIPGREASEVEHRLDADLDGRISLQGYSLVSDEVQAGDILQLTLFWQATGPIAERLKVFAHVLDAEGHLIGQRDAEPMSGTSFTNTWSVGQEVTDRYGLPIPHGTPPGEYLVEVGMYTPGDGRRLPVLEGGAAVADRILLPPVRVTRADMPPPVAALDMQEPRPLAGDGLALLGFSLGRAGALDQGRVPLRPGEVAELVLFWQAADGDEDPQVLLRLVDRGGRVWVERRLAPAGGRYPVRDWQPQEIVRDPVHLPLPADLPAGRYRLLAGWPGGNGPGQTALHELAALVVQ